MARATVVRLLCLLALLGAACGSTVVAPPATSLMCSHDTPDPGVCSPLRHPV
ncbi:MAG TPA: hypothetical protein VFO28_19010 [Burkholderiaceae bacterium]|nr:hypothetical protein [Burkholderiaceae bacterium]